MTNTKTTSRYFLGVDGGGTNCRARLADAEGNTLGEGKGGPANVNLEGGKVAHRSILHAAGQAFAAAGLPEAAMGETDAALGLAGAEVGDALGTFRALAFPFNAVRIYSDGEVACLGAHGGEDGGIVILGTGAKITALVGGETRDKGGWGFWLGDHASGADIGRSAVRLVGLAIDGPVDGDIEAAALTEAILSRHDHDPVKLAGWAKAAAPGDYGALAPIVFDLADQGDASARGLIEAAAHQFMRMIRLTRELGVDRVAPIGSVANRLARDWLDPEVSRLSDAKADATQGSVMAAMWGGLKR